MQHRIVIVTLAFIAATTGCNEQPTKTAVTDATIVTSGKEATDLSSVPKEVMAAARLARPDLAIVEAEYETRGGNEYYDVGGLLPDGSELELDMTLTNGTWTVVEIQRDIDLSLVPQAVHKELTKHLPGWNSQRIIESDQGDGVIIYEMFGHQGSGESVKKEIKWENDQAEMLTKEWIH